MNKGEKKREEHKPAQVNKVKRVKRKQQANKRTRQTSLTDKQRAGGGQQERDEEGG